MGGGGATIDGVQILGNTIGLTAAQDAKRPNAGDGVHLIDASNAVVSGNAIGGNGYCSVSILSPGTANQVVDNYIGTNASGDDLGNIRCGVFDAATLSQIGAAGLGNVIGFNPVGVEIDVGAIFSFVEANWIGTNAAGADLGNATNGVDDEAGSVIGGVGSGNVIGRNGGAGIYLHDTADGAIVTGNWIGTNASGADLENGDAGVVVNGATEVSVGASLAFTVPSQILDRANVIAFNEGAGVEITGALASGNTVRGNEMFDNRGIGVDLVPYGATPNDPDDTDIGTNGYQNSPELQASGTSYDDVLDELTVEYLVDSEPAHSAYPIEVDFYRLGADGEEPREWLGGDTWTLAGPRPDRADHVHAQLAAVDHRRDRRDRRRRRRQLE